MRRKSTLENALPIVAAAYAEKFGVKISIGGNVAYTDGESINLPVIPENAPQAQAVWGYLAHEGAHIRFTDFSVQRRPGIHSEMVNIIEDMRIERQMIRTYPGTAETLLETCQYMIQAGHYQVPKPGSHPAQVLSAFCLYYLQAKGVDQPPLLPILAVAEATIKADFPSTVVSAIVGLLDEAIAECDSTQSAADYADKLLALIKEQEEQQEQEQGDGDGDGDNQDQDQDQGDGESQSQDQGGDNNGDGGNQDQDDQGQSSGDGESQSQDDQGQSRDQNASSDASEQSDNSSGTQGQGSDADSEQQGESQQQSDQAGQPGSAQEQSQNAGESQSISEQLEQAGPEDLMGDPRDALKSDLQASNQQPFQNGAIKAVPAVQTVDPKPNGEGLAYAAQVSSGIRQRLWGLVQSSQRKGSRNARSGRRISATRLARTKAGETKVFERREAKQAPNTAIHILVDMSGSMGGPSYMCAREAGLAVALALQGIPGTNPAVTFFDGIPHGDGLSPRLRAGLKHGERVDIDRFNVDAYGSTPMADALWYAANELRKCKEERKLIVCITDGEPDCIGSTQNILALCEESGYEAIGIGISSTSVERLFKKNIVINNVNELRSTLFQLMENALTAA